MLDPHEKENDRWEIWFPQSRLDIGFETISLGSSSTSDAMTKSCLIHWCLFLELCKDIVFGKKKKKKTSKMKTWLSISLCSSSPCEVLDSWNSLMSCSWHEMRIHKPAVFAQHTRPSLKNIDNLMPSCPNLLLSCPTSPNRFDMARSF